MIGGKECLAALVCAFVLVGYGCTGGFGNITSEGDGFLDDADVTSDDGGARDDDGDDRDNYDSHYVDDYSGEVVSYIWIANSAEGTVSKLDTATGDEVARYYAGPQESGSDPSRTSVNLHGDAVVTCRDPWYGDRLPDQGPEGGEGGGSSVSKFAAAEEDCIDRNGNGLIDTSHGPNQVLPWGEDECMLWNTPLESELDSDDMYFLYSIGARATAWDGQEDPQTGLGGSVWVGAHYTGEIFQLDGDDGEIAARTRWDGGVSSPWQDMGQHGAYGGAMDGLGNFWIFDGSMYLGRLDTTTLEIDTYEVPCGYGIAVDSQNRVWTSGAECVNRFDPSTGQNTTYRSQDCFIDDASWGQSCFFRGLAVDGKGSVWVADTYGSVLRISEDGVELERRVELSGASGIVGVAVDYFGKVWAVAQESNAAVRIDPATYQVDRFPVGLGPYTYSDMTGFQLRTVVLY